jgi:hypothetical protein
MEQFQCIIRIEVRRKTVSEKSALASHMVSDTSIILASFDSTSLKTKPTRADWEFRMGCFSASRR